MNFSVWWNWLAASLVILSSYIALFLCLVCILYLLQRIVFALSARLFRGKCIYLSAWIGTPIHELSHAIFCVLFGHKIQRIVLFSPNESHTLGFVNHSYNNRNMWQVMGNFFIGIAPLFGGLAALYGTTNLLLEDASILFQFLLNSPFKPSQLFDVDVQTEFVKSLFSFMQGAYARSPILFLLWGYTCAAISLHLSPSSEDIKGVGAGFVIFLLICLMSLAIEQFFNTHIGNTVKAHIDMFSMIYVIGILWASLLVSLMVLAKGIVAIIK